AAAEVDAQWFRDNPLRSYRVRPPFVGELEWANPPIWNYPWPYAHVRQVVPSIQVRFFACHEWQVTNYTEEAACGMWHFFAKGWFSPETLRSIDERERRGRRLS